MSRGVSFKGVIIAVMVVFFGLMALVWVLSERADPKMIPQSAPPTSPR